MNKRYSPLAYIVLVVVIAIILINSFIDAGPLRFICNLLATIASIHVLINAIIPRARFVRRLNSGLRKFKVLAVLLPKEEEPVVKSGDPFYRFKADLLSYTINQISDRTTLINNPEIFKIDFTVDYKFNHGTHAHDQTDDWKNNMGRQFVLITGKAGGGKTYELIKRAAELCAGLSPGLAQHDLLEKQKIPLYIELKSLDTEMDPTWILDYVQKTATIANKQIDESQLINLIVNKEVIYFFDGLDEVQTQFRNSCVAELIRLSTGTGVHVSCRKDIFSSLDKKGIFTIKPAEYLMHPISTEQVSSVVKNVLGKSEKEKEDIIEFLAGKPGLVKHMSRPIFLNLFLVVYDHLTPDQKDILESSDEDTTMDVLWENYEDIIYKKKLPKDSDMLAIRTISVWLAKIMSGAAFYVESIQPKWLWKVEESRIVSHKGLQKLYYLVTRVFAASMVGIAFGCIISTPFALLSNSILAGAIISMTAGIYDRKIKMFRMPERLATFLFSTSLVLLLTVGCGIYQGLSVPRGNAEMANSVFSFTETWPGILLGMVLSIIFSYRIILEKKKNQYILPIELFHFDWPHAVRYGLGWGLASGIITGGIALFVRHQYSNAIFIKTWLIPRLQSLVTDLGFSNNDVTLDAAIFCYAFIITFFVASLIVVLLAGRYNDTMADADLKKKQKLNYGIRRSWKHASSHAIKVAVLVGALYYAVMMGFGRGSLLHGIKISLGISILAFLWFGGLEVINHIILRINLYIRGIAPLNYDRWVQLQQNMGLIIPSGYQMKFYHSTLAGYYSRYSLTDNPRVRVATKKSLDIFFYLGVLGVALTLLILPFVMRYKLNVYWTRPSEIKTDFKGIGKLNDSIFLVQHTGVYEVHASGRVKLGTFTGYAWPKGTRYGFMGMPMEGAYNMQGLKKYHHGALLLKIKKAGSAWTPYRYVYNIKRLTADKGDLLQFIVNDNEWQNNIGRYKVSLRYCDSCK